MICSFKNYISKYFILDKKCILYKILLVYIVNQLHIRIKQDKKRKTKYILNDYAGGKL